jgi:ketosteroid isomerase-like protein
MLQNNRAQKLLLIFLIFLLAIILTACKGLLTSKNEQVNHTVMPILSKEVILPKIKKCDTLFRAHIDAWNSRDVNNIREIYTEDIVHFDGKPLFEGIDEVANMAVDIWAEFPKWEMKDGNNYLSEDACLGEWINWGIFTFSEDDPGLEFDLLNFRESQISYWRLYYDRKFLNVFGHGYYIDENLLNDFGAAWSSDDPDKIAEIYSDNASLTDSLFDISLEGNNAISDYAAAYFAQFPGVQWKLTYAFAENYPKNIKEDNPFHPIGGVYTITIQDSDQSSCDIQAVVLISPDNDHQIMEQTIYYDGESLINCRLAN